MTKMTKLISYVLMCVFLGSCAHGYSNELALKSQDAEKVYVSCIKDYSSRLASSPSTPETISVAATTTCASELDEWARAFQAFGLSGVSTQAQVNWVNSQTVKAKNELFRSAQAESIRIVVDARGAVNSPR